MNRWSRIPRNFPPTATSGEEMTYSFFKLMLSPSTQFKKLRLPEKFARTFRDELSTACILTVPTGKTQRVALLEEDNHLWFTEGWLEFVEYFSIGFAYFLLFIYEGHSNFKVHIFDISTCEISYNDDDQVSVKSLQSPSTSSGSILLNDYDEVLKAISAVGIPIPENPYFASLMKDYAVYRPRSLNVPFAFARDHLKCKAGETVLIETQDEKRWPVRCRRNYKGCSLGKGWLDFTHKARLEVGDICLFQLTDAKRNVLKVQIAKKSRIKAAGFATIHHKGDHHVNVKRFPSPPTSSNDSDIEVIKPDSKHWEVKPHAGSQHSTMTLDANGWTSMGLPNWMKSYGELTEAVSASGISLPENPFFVAMIKLYALKTGFFLNVPRPFVREHLRCNSGDRITIKTHAGRQWSVSFRLDHATCKFGKGWIDFARDIGLKVGDICVFELVDAKYKVLKVQVVESQINAA